MQFSLLPCVPLIHSTAYVCVQDLRIHKKMSEYQMSETRIKPKISIMRHRSARHSAPSFHTNDDRKAKDSGGIMWSY